MFKIYWSRGDIIEVYHCENIDKVSDEFIEKKRLIIMVDSNIDNYVQTLIKVLSSWIIEKIDNYNSSMYYENPNYIYECYKEGKVL